MYYQSNRDDTRNSGGGDEVRTLFISGLPDDVKEREIHNLFRLVPGYEGCKLTSVNRGPVAFASFTDRNSASVGQSYLDGIKFDPNYPTTLRIEFAKSNSITKRLIEEDTYQNTKRFRTQYTRPLVPIFSLPSTETRGTDTHRKGGDPNRPPCTTLFVTNIDSQTTEEDLAHIFGSVPGFKRLRLPGQEGRRGRNAFVEYADIPSAQSALYSLQTYPLGSCYLRIEFAKSKMGEKGNRARDRQKQVIEEPKNDDVEEQDEEKSEGEEQIDDEEN